MGVQGVGGFLIIVLLISLVAGGLCVYSYNQQNLIQEQNTSLVEMQSKLNQVNEQLKAYEMTIETSKKEILKIRSENEACILSVASNQQENMQLKAQITELTNQLAIKQGALDQALSKIAATEVDQPDNNNQPSVPVAEPVQQGSSNAIPVTGFDITGTRTLAALPLLLLLFSLVEVAFRTIARARKTETIRVTQEERDLIIRYRRSRGKR